MSKQWTQEYEALVITADKLYDRIEECGQLIERILKDVYRGNYDNHFNEAYFLILAAAEIQSDLLIDYCYVRLMKTFLARLIDGSNPIH